MLSVTEAFRLLLEHIQPFESTDCSLQESLGLTLGHDVFSQTDSPPFDKALMDGFAVNSADLINSSVTLEVIEVVTAGRVPVQAIKSGQAIQIMTGAPIPEGADAVIKIEDTRPGDGQVEISSKSIKPGTNLIRKGTSIKCGDRILSAGDQLNGSRIGALAELGYSRVSVRRRPSVAILATGDELVEIDQLPGPGQIRNSNGAMLAAQLKSAGADVLELGIARDDRTDLQAKIRHGLKADLLILSGGVSAGTLDLVPSTLLECGVNQVFHKVEMKPGKPIWFGEYPEQNDDKVGTLRKCFVFGLPGNPVSSLVCSELFVRAALRRLAGIQPAIAIPLPAHLSHAYSARSDRPTYHPAKISWSQNGLSVELVPWHGSSDLCGTVTANGMAFLSGVATEFRPGDIVDTFPWAGTPI